MKYEAPELNTILLTATQAVASLDEELDKGKDGVIVSNSDIEIPL